MEVPESPIGDPRCDASKRIRLAGIVNNQLDVSRIESKYAFYTMDRVLRAVMCWNNYRENRACAYISVHC